jgi:hypothetical protein
VKWNAGDPSGSKPDAVIADDNMYEVYFADIDAKGNCYLDGFDESYLPQVDELPGCTSASGTNLGISLAFPGGVYVREPNHGADLSVVDQGTDGSGKGVLYLYVLGSYKTPDYTSNPPQNIQHTCDPVAGGWSKDGDYILIGDSGCHAGDLATGFFGSGRSIVWESLLNINFNIPIDGAFVSSDK